MKEDKEGRVYVQGLTEVDVTTPQQARRVVQQGGASRRKAETALNYQSSRSHSVFTVTLVDAGGARLSKLSFVDLAGSERVARCAGLGRVHAWAGEASRPLGVRSDRALFPGVDCRAQTRGTRLQEAISINSSLMTLGRCLQALRASQNAGKDKDRRQAVMIPYR